MIMVRQNSFSPRNGEVILKMPRMWLKIMQITVSVPAMGK